MLVPDPANEKNLHQWIVAARAADLPHLHSFTKGLELDIKAATAAITLPHHNGRTEGVNTKTKKSSGTCSAGRLRTPPPPHPARIRALTVTAGSATEPLKRLLPAHPMYAPE
jgi:hypothetical protein